MTNFEQKLLDNGYIKYILNCKTMKYEEPKGHITSTMQNLDHRYFHKDDKVLEKIRAGKSVMDADFTWEDRKNEIVFGLHEKGKPSTLISPRPQIEVKRYEDGKLVITQNEDFDDSMNYILANVSAEEIFLAMYDKEKCFKVELSN
jgi:hypothetical protein